MLVRKTKKPEKVRSKQNRIRFLQCHARTTVTQTQQLLDLRARKKKTYELLRAKKIDSLMEQTVEQSIGVSAQIRI